MALEGSEREQLHQVLIKAFPPGVGESLKQVLDASLSENLDVIVGGGNYSEKVFNLIQWLEARNKLQEFINAACEANSGNQDLQNFKEQILVKVNRPRQNEEESLLSEGEPDNEIGYSDDSNDADQTKLKNYRAKLKNYRDKFIWILLILMIISSGSVIASYYQLLLVKSLDKLCSLLGLLIELTRGLIVAVLAIELMDKDIFLEEALEFFGVLKPLQNNSKRHLYLLRLIAAFLGVFICISLLYYHFIMGPSEFFSNHKQSNDNSSNIELLRYTNNSYLWYLPYSTINFLIIGLPLFIIGIYSEIKDLTKLSNKKKVYNYNIKEIFKARDACVCNEILKEFQKLRKYYNQLVTRYIRACWAFSIGFGFELIAGRFPLNNSAKMITFFGYFWLCCVFVIIFRGVYLYEKAFSLSSDRLTDCNCGNYGNFEEDNNTIKLAMQIMQRNSSAILTVIILFVSIIVSLVLDAKMKSWLPSC